MSTKDKLPSSEGDEPPKKRKYVSKKKTTDTTNAQEKLYQGVIRSYIDRYAEKKRISQQQIKTITSFIEEYLQAFIIVGYNHDGEIITHVSSKNQIHTDALNTCIYKFITQKARDKDSPASGLCGDDLL